MDLAALRDHALEMLRVIVTDLRTSQTATEQSEQRPALIAFCLNVIGVFGAFTLPYLLGPAQPQMMGVYMQQTYGEYQDRSGAETQAVITFLISAVVGILYVRTITRQRAERR